MTQESGDALLWWFLVFIVGSACLILLAEASRHFVRAWKLFRDVLPSRQPPLLEWYKEQSCKAIIRERAWKRARQRAIHYLESNRPGEAAKVLRMDAKE